MSPPFASILRSLEFRLLAPLSLTVGAVLAVHAIVGFHSTQDHFSRFVRAEIERCGELITGATHDGMLLNRLGEVQAMIRRLANAPEVASIRVYNMQGRIVLSADPSELGTLASENSEVCRSCHEPGRVKENGLPEKSVLMHIGDGNEVLRRLTVIENEEACSAAACHFHSPDTRALGVLNVEMSTAPLQAAIGEARRQLMGTTLVLILISGLVAALFVRRLIHEPVMRIHEGTQRIAAGDLDTRIDVRGGHELAGLAEAFNRMAADLRSAHREVTSWSHTLEQKIAAKTEEVQQVQRQVLHMETMASLGKLSATVAHELNNPIGAVLTYARLVRRLLAEQSMDDKVREEIDRYLTLMDRECSRCGTIVHNLLTFARRRGAAMALVDLNEIVDRSLMLIDHHLKINGVQLRRQHLENDSRIIADSGQIEQALLALLMNALDAMQANAGSEATLTVRLQGDDTRVGIDISDTGVGIPDDVLEHIFEPFFSTKGNESGVGLGLAVVYGIVNRHGGTIEVTSASGQGTTFHIDLPRDPPASDDHTYTAPDAVAVAVGSPHDSDGIGR